MIIIDREELIKNKGNINIYNDVILNLTDIDLVKVLELIIDLYLKENV